MFVSELKKQLMERLKQIHFQCLFRALLVLLLLIQLVPTSGTFNVCFLLYYADYVPIEERFLQKTFNVCFFAVREGSETTHNQGSDLKHLSMFVSALLVNVHVVLLILPFNVCFRVGDREARCTR
ncbi:MAG: hypothetical protein DRJ40_06240 [Thermoprotei archaeon]|nr:MAG: hypothetical protein DRJ40_06240 [Thermoprotei archaeon]